MKKIVLTLVVLMLAAPAWAAVNITAAQVGDTNEVVISFDATGETNLVRAFSLNLQLDDDATILDVGNVNADYYIYPGTIQIDTSTTPPTINYGTPVAEYGDLPSDTLPGLDTNGVTLEMGSLYSVAQGDPVPVKSGVLLSIYVSRPADDTTCLSISGNVSRAGSSGIVMENPDEVVTVSATGTCVTFPSLACMGERPQAEQDQWAAVGKPECWCYARQCNGDADGLPYGKSNYWTALPDLAVLKAAWNQNAASILNLKVVDKDPACTLGCDVLLACADFDRLPYGKNDYRVALPDLTILKQNWAKANLPDPNCLPGNRAP